jgi:hypothetical protein
VGSKRLRYEQLGVKEYFIFDPLRDYLQPPLKGFRLLGQYYTPMPDQPLSEEEWRLQSELLKLELHTEGQQLRLFDPQTGAYLRTPHEEAEARADAETQAQALAAEVARLNAELAKRSHT